MKASSFDLIQKATLDPGHPAHFAVLSTLNQATPEARLVVLRRWEPEIPLMETHTDIRSSKWKELINNHLHSLHLWFPEEKIQMRLRCQSSLHTGDAFSSEIWEALTPSNKLNYLQEKQPGSPLAERKATRFSFEDLSKNEASAKKHFGVIRSKILEMDWLLLHPEGQLRGLFQFAGNEVKSQWLVP